LMSWMSRPVAPARIEFPVGDASFSVAALVEFSMAGSPSGTSYLGGFHVAVRVSPLTLLYVTESRSQRRQRRNDDAGKADDRKAVLKADSQSFTRCPDGLIRNFSDGGRRRTHQRSLPEAIPRRFLADTAESNFTSMVRTRSADCGSIPWKVFPRGPSPTITV
jgi:hypothetical protein